MIYFPFIKHDQNLNLKHFLNNHENAYLQPYKTGTLKNTKSKK